MKLSYLRKFYPIPYHNILGNVYIPGLSVFRTAIVSVIFQAVVTNSTHQTCKIRNNLPRLKSTSRPVS